MSKENPKFLMLNDFQSSYAHHENMSILNLFLVFQENLKTFSFFFVSASRGQVRLICLFLSS
jgi:hypothetical protein